MKMGMILGGKLRVEGILALDAAMIGFHPTIAAEEATRTLTKKSIAIPPQTIAPAPLLIRHCDPKKRTRARYFAAPALIVMTMSAVALLFLLFGSRAQEANASVHAPTPTTTITSGGVRVVAASVPAPAPAEPSAKPLATMTSAPPRHTTVVRARGLDRAKAARWIARMQHELDACANPLPCTDGELVFTRGGETETYKHNFKDSARTTASCDERARGATCAMDVVRQHLPPPWPVCQSSDACEGGDDRDRAVLEIRFK